MKTFLKIVGGFFLLMIVIGTIADNGDKAKSQQNSTTQQAQIAANTQEMVINLKSFYPKIIALSDPADKALEKSFKVAQGGDSFATYASFKNDTLPLVEAAELQFDSLKNAVPQLSSKDDMDKIKDGLNDLSTAYYAKKDAIKSLLDGIDNDKISAVNEGIQKMKESQKIAISGMVKILGIYDAYGIDTVKLTTK